MTLEEMRELINFHCDEIRKLYHPEDPLKVELLLVLQRPTEHDATLILATDPPQNFIPVILQSITEKPIKIMPSMADKKVN